ncbi:MAG: hypothetical protein RR367_00670 [Clostridia bacterium]
MKRSKLQWALSILLAIATLAMAIAGTTGFIMHSGGYAAQKLEDMRTYAVIHTAAGKIIDQVAKEAKSTAKEWASAKNETTGEPNIKGRDNQRAYYNAAEDAARAEAEVKYAQFEGMDLSPLTLTIPKVEAAEKAYYDVEAQEKAIYAAVYLKAHELAGTQSAAWLTELESKLLTFEQLTEERLAAAEAPYAELDEEGKLALSTQLAQPAASIAAVFGLTAAQASDGFAALRGTMAEALPLYAAMDAAAKASADAALAPAMEALTRVLGGLYGTSWVSREALEAQIQSFSAAAMAIAAQDYAAAYGTLPDKAEKGFAKAFQKLFTSVVSDAQAASMQALSAEAAPVEDDVDVAEAVVVDYVGFVGSEALTALNANIDAEYNQLWSAVMTILPSLTEDMREDQKAGIEAVIYAPDERFEAKYARLSEAKATLALDQTDAFKMSIAASASNLLLGAIALLVITLVAFFYQPLVKKLGVPRLIIGLFFVMLLILSGLYGLNMSSMMSNVLKRTGQYGILVLAMLPGIQCGISLNMGMTVGIVAGLLSTLIALEANMTGWLAFWFAVVVGCIFAAPIGWAYAKLLNRLKGNEMTVSTYVGFSFVSLMSIFWMILPFHNPKLTWALGSGLRVMHTMAGNIGGLLNNFLSFSIFGVTIPTGLLLFLLLCCGILWLFSRSRTGTAMIAAGSNPRFAEAAGISVDRMRTIGTTLSTVVAAVGIIVYSQSFGFMQLYSGPRQMGFTAASAILIGGASTSRAKVSHVIIGTFLFQGVLSMGILVANQAISANGLSEVMRILISNGIILYALTQSGGETNA